MPGDTDRAVEAGLRDAILALHHPAEHTDYVAIPPVTEDVCFECSVGDGYQKWPCQTAQLALASSRPAAPDSPDRLREALTSGIAFAIARAPVPSGTDTARDIASRLAPLVIESGYLSVFPRSDTALDVDTLTRAMERAAGHERVVAALKEGRPVPSGSRD